MTAYSASPSVRVYAANKGVDLARLAAETGRITLGKEDVDRHLTGDAAQAPSLVRHWQVDHARHGPVEEVPLTRPQRIAAENLSAANTLIPQVTHHDRAEMSAVEAFRARCRDEAEAEGIRLTALAFHVAALARTLARFPRFNASLTPDGERLVLKRYIHVGIAVDTPHGLLVPVIRDAARKGLWALAEAIADLAARAQARRTRPEEMGGASMSISNLGGIGGHGFTPIVNPPEVAILGIARTSIEPVWHGDAFRPAPMCPLSLSYDHRVVNGADAARFLAHYGSLLADPRRLML